VRVTILGSGTAVPVEDRFPPGVLVENDGTWIVVDLGPGVLRRLAQAQVRIDWLHAVLLTHFHPECDGHDLAAQARAAFAGEVVLARDLMRFDLGADAPA
jgi:ribonuclease BN (tRNA processing enzyme)